MEKVLKKIFSMGLMTLFLFAFFIAIAAATFIENDFGTPVAQKLVYKSTWFSAIILYLTLTLVFNIYRYKLLQWKKIASLTFHAAFIIIVMGAAFTRYFGFEGAMLIPAGGASNEIISSDTYLHLHVNDEVMQYSEDFPVIFEGETTNSFEHSVDFPGQEKPISFSFSRLIENVKDTLIPCAPKFGDPYLEIVIAGDRGREYYYLKSENRLEDVGFKITFNRIDETDAIRVFETDSGLYFISPFDMTYFQMADQSDGLIMRDSLQPFVPKRLYSNGNNQFVFNNYYPGGNLETISSKEETGIEEVALMVKQGDLFDTMAVRGGKGTPMLTQEIKLGDLNIRIGYGSIIRFLPFYIYLDKFELETYPGTMNPSSYSSYVTVVDPDLGIEEPHHIFMNNVMDYGGYRFFQSDYDKKAQAYTILSVNQDTLGTTTTYIGYLLLAIGFVLNLLSPHARFRMLLRKLNEIKAKKEALVLALIFALGSLNTIAQENQIIDVDHADRYGHLIIQDFKGRFKPVQTVASEVLRKVSRQSTYNGLTDMQVFLGLHTNIVYWNAEELVYVSGSAVRTQIGIPETQSRASIMQFFDAEDFTYKLEADVETAQHKKPSEQSTYDKDILKTDERVNVLLGVLNGAYLKIMPLPNDSTNTWYTPFTADHPFTGNDQMLFEYIIPMYNSAVQEGFETGNWSAADTVVYIIDTYQRKVAPAELIPTKATISLEITYNKLDLFKRLMNGYIIIGLILLIIEFIRLFVPKLKLNWVHYGGLILFWIMFIGHGTALGIRWYLSGHAPWSNGYEAVVFIAFITVLAGLLFVRNSRIVLGATGILAWLMLFVAHMNQMDPEITSLVPVLKSYWLMIHVAIITGSYGFLGLGAILALICIFLNLSLTKSNARRIQLTTKELTYVSELVLTIGLFMLTIGTFLGGIWANESWGRYWGWDAKETWALASVLAYAIVLHLRFIPGLKSQFVFNSASLWAYGSIIMTFFGVNFYLSGLHSYATGDPVPIPLWIPISVSCLFVINVLAFIRKYQVIGSSLSKKRMPCPMKSLAKSSDCTEILARIEGLREDTPSSWGAMNAGEALCHLADQLRLMNGDILAEDSSNLILRTLVKQLVLIGVPAPKGKVQTLPEINVHKKGTKPTYFENDKNILRHLIEKAVTLKPDEIYAHGAFGELSKKQWLRLAYIHLDHHLKQFGV